MFDCCTRLLTLSCDFRVVASPERGFLAHSTSNLAFTSSEQRPTETMSKLPAVFADTEDSQLVADAKKQVPEDQDYSYTERDVILYNLGIGATAQELQWTYENHDEFGALPTFGVIPQFGASSGSSLEWLPNFNPVRFSNRILRPTLPCLTNCVALLLAGDNTFASFPGRRRQSFYTANNTCPSKLLYLLKPTS